MVSLGVTIVLGVGIQRQRKVPAPKTHRILLDKVLGVVGDEASVCPDGRALVTGTHGGVRC